MSLIRGPFERIFRGQIDISVDLSRRDPPCLGGYWGGNLTSMSDCPAESPYFWGALQVPVGHVRRPARRSHPIFEGALQVHASVSVLTHRRSHPILGGHSKTGFGWTFCPLGGVSLFLGGIFGAVKRHRCRFEGVFGERWTLTNSRPARNRSLFEWIFRAKQTGLTVTPPFLTWICERSNRPNAANRAEETLRTWL